MAVSREALALQTLQEDCLEQIVNLILGYDAYWCSHSPAGELPEEVQLLRKRLQEQPKPSLSEVLAETHRLLEGKEKSCLQALYPMLLQVEKGESLPTLSKQLRTLLKEAKDLQFAADLKSVGEALSKAKGDKPMEAKLQYELGLLYVKKDPVHYRKQALEAFNQAIGLKVAEIGAYALRERAALQEEEGAKRADLEQAYQLIKGLKKEAGELKDQWRAFFAYGLFLLQSQDFAKAVEVLREARPLRPHHGPTLSALLQAYTGLKQYTNPLECLQDVELGASDLEGVNEYFAQIGKSLWLEIAASGSVSLLERCAPYLDKQAVDKAGNNALHYAARAGHLAASQSLGHWLDYESVNHQGMTPVLVAAQYGRVSLVLEYLFKQGVSPFTPQKDVLSIIVQNAQGCVFLALVEKKKEYEALLIEVGQPYSESQKESKEYQEQCRGAAVGQMYRVAIDSKNLEMLKLLIVHHPEGLSLLYKGESPLHYALQKQFTPGIYLLVEQGASLEQQNLSKQTPLQIAEGDLVAYLKNALRKQQQIVKKVPLFIESVVKQFSDTLEEPLPAEAVRGLTENLRLVFSKTLYAPLFDSEQLPLLANHLVKAFTEHLEVKGAIDKHTLIPLIESIAKGFQRPIVKQQQEQKSLEEARLTPATELFCERFEKQWDEAYGHFRALSSGEMVSLQELKKQQELKATQDKVVQLPTLNLPVVGVPLPLGVLASGAMSLMLYFRERYYKQEIERMVSLFKGIGPLERAHFIHYTAEQLARKYQNQIQHLAPGSEGVEQFADCAVARVVEYIISSDDHQADNPSHLSEAIRAMKSWVLGQEIPPEQRRQKSLHEVFLQGIIRVTSSFPKERERLHTVNHSTLTDNWNAKGIFESTGVLLESGERYAHPNVDIDCYGYCLGTLSEAQKRGLSLGPSKGQLWGPGRAWEAPLASAPLSPRAQAEPLLPAYQALQDRAASASPPGDKPSSPFSKLKALLRG